MTRSEMLELEPVFRGMFAVIPAVIMQDKSMPMSAKMLYGIITWRCNEFAYCWASNQALSDDLGISAKRVSALVSELEKAGHVEVQIVRDRETNQVLQRRIYPIVKSARKHENPQETPCQPSPQKKGDLPSFSGGPTPKNEEYKYKNKLKVIIPPIVPPKGEPCEKKTTAKKEPNWKPGRFQRFWDSYPRGQDKQAAIREWDRLKPDDSLLKEMALGLARDLQSPDWQRGIGIPYACRWLKNRRWEDEQDHTPAHETHGQVEEQEEAYRL